MGKVVLKGLPEEVCGFMFAHYSEKMPLSEVWRSDSSDTGTGGDAKRILGSCCKRLRSILVHDAEKDPQMRGIKVRSFQSALCVPVLDDQQQLQGVLFFASGKPGVFTKEHRYAVERAARDLAVPLSGMRKAPETEADATEEITPVFASPSILVAIGLAVVLFMVWAAAPDYKTKERPRPMVTNSLNSQVRDAAESFLTSLRTERYDNAWLLMDRQLQRQWSAQDFGSAMRAWTEEGENKGALQNCQIVKLQRHNQVAQVFLSGPTGDRGYWVWEFEKRSSDWVLVSLDGPLKKSSKGM